MNKKKPVLTAILIALCMILLGCSMRNTPIGYHSYDNASRYASGDAAVSDRVNTLDVSWIDGSVTIGYHSGKEILLSEKAARSLTADTKMHWLVDGSTLYVKYAESGLRLSSNLSKELTILLPEGLQLKDLKLSVVSSRVQAEDLTADTIRFDTVSGSAELDVATAKQLITNGVSGKLTVTAGRLDEMKADTVSGDLRLTLNRMPKKIDADSISGDVTINLPAKPGFTATLNTVSGSVSGSMSMEKQGKDRYICGDGSCTIKVDTVSGDVRLDK